MNGRVVAGGRSALGVSEQCGISGSSLQTTCSGDVSAAYKTHHRGEQAGPGGNNQNDAAFHPCIYPPQSPPGTLFPACIPPEKAGHGNEDRIAGPPFVCHRECGCGWDRVE